MKELVRRVFIYIIKVCKLYIDYVNSFFEYGLEPLSDYISNYSSTLAYTIDNTRKIVSGFVLYIPIFLASLIPIVANTPNLDSTLTDYQVLFASILFVSSIISIYVSRFILNNSWKDTIYTFSILSVSSFLLIYYNETPYSYFILLVIIYGIGAFSQSKIEFDRAVSHDYIYDLNPHAMIALSSIASIFVIPVIVLSDAYLDNYKSTVYFVACSMIYLVTVYQETQYRLIYSGIDINTSSRFWILSPRLGVVVGSILILSSSISLVYGIPFLLLPFLFGCLFYIYFEYMTNKHVGDVVFRGLEDSMHGESRNTVLENVSIDSKSDENASKLSIELDICVAKRLEESSGDNLAESVILLKHIENILVESDFDEGQESYQDLKAFYDNQIDLIIDQDFDIAELPHDIRRRIISRMSERECITNQEIQDLTMKNQEIFH